MTSVLLLLLAAAPPSSDSSSLLEILLATPRAERTALLQSRPPSEWAEALKAASTEALLSHGEKVLRKLGPYRARVEKQERVDGKLQVLQVSKVSIRPEPLAIRVEFLQGDSPGRKVLYDAAVRKRELKVRERGLLGVVGAVWIDLDNPRTRKSTNHPVTDLGFGPLLQLLRKDLQASQAWGGFARTDEGFDAKGRYRLTFTAPAGARGLYARKARLAIDLALGLPTWIEIEDAQGLLERYEWLDIAPAAASDFEPDL